MKKRIINIITLLLIVLCLSACDASTDSTFSIQFIDVGQGDAALIECDGQYMLIDGGPKSAGDKIHQILEDNNASHLSILAISHLHDDHYGGLVTALSYDTMQIDKTICNSDYAETKSFKELEHELWNRGAPITIPLTDDEFRLGSARIEVVDASAESDNDSLVLMITYGKNRFLFTGDIEDEAQRRIADKYENENDAAYKIDLIKIPHHGAASSSADDESGTTIRFIRTFTPEYAVISVGSDNIYGHPNQKTLDLLNQADAKVYRTDKNGDITVKSDGKTLKITTEK